jgi:hypothetical protein
VGGSPPCRYDTALAQRDIVPRIRLFHVGAQRRVQQRPWRVLRIFVLRFGRFLLVGVQQHSRRVLRIVVLRSGRFLLVGVQQRPWHVLTIFVLRSGRFLRVGVQQRPWHVLTIFVLRSVGIEIGVEKQNVSLRLNDALSLLVLLGILQQLL